MLKFILAVKIKACVFEDLEEFEKQQVKCEI